MPADIRTCGKDFANYRTHLRYWPYMNPYSKFSSNLSRFVRVIMRGNQSKSVANSGRNDLLIPDGFCSLSNSSEILVICTHIPSRVENHVFFQLSRGNLNVQKYRRTDRETNVQTDVHISSQLTTRRAKLL